MQKQLQTWRQHQAKSCERIALPVLWNALSMVCNLFVSELAACLWTVIEAMTAAHRLLQRLQWGHHVSSSVPGAAAAHTHLQCSASCVANRSRNLHLDQRLVCDNSKFETSNPYPPMPSMIEIFFCRASQHGFKLGNSVFALWAMMFVRDD
jgi:hypothetical protein